MQEVIARLLTDTEYQDRFFSDATSHHGTHGLSLEEFEALQRIDSAKLGIVSEGYTGKRLERVESCFPRTLALLQATQAGFWAHYLAHTPFPADDAEERSTFLDYIHADVHDWTPDAKRLLEDLASLEFQVHQTPLPASAPTYRFQPESTRPVQSRHVVRFQSRGPLLDAWRATETRQMPAEYPKDPLHWLVTHDGGSVRLEPLFQDTLTLLSACDGRRTVAALEENHGPGTRPLIQQWLRRGVVVDATTHDGSRIGPGGAP